MRVSSGDCVYVSSSDDCVNVSFIFSRSVPHYAIHDICFILFAHTIVCVHVSSVYCVRVSSVDSVRVSSVDCVNVSSIDRVTVSFYFSRSVTAQDLLAT